MWKYLTDHWFRVLSQKKVGTRKKIPSHRWWELIQQAQPLSSKPVLDPADLQEVAFDLEPRVKQAAGHLRKIAGLSDTYEDCVLAQIALLDAAADLAAGKESRNTDDPMAGVNLPEDTDG